MVFLVFIVLFRVVETTTLHYLFTRNFYLEKPWFLEVTIDSKVETKKNIYIDVKCIVYSKNDVYSSNLGETYG